LVSTYERHTHFPPRGRKKNSSEKKMKREKKEKRNENYFQSPNKKKIAPGVTRYMSFMKEKEGIPLKD
jgi:hypothetical protein